MIFEGYQLRLDHYFRDTESKERTPVEDPIVVRVPYDRISGRRASVLNEMLERMKQEVLVRTKYKDETEE